MRFFRWILSNIILIVIIFGLIYTYVYWGNLTGSDTPGGKVVTYLTSHSSSVREFVNAIKEKHQQRSHASNVEMNVNVKSVENDQQGQQVVIDENLKNNNTVVNGGAMQKLQSALTNSAANSSVSGNSPQQLTKQPRHHPL